MFVLHPSSRCDVCLEPFDWETDMAPYAIPCGHVFCKTCLESVTPPKCPMCRKNFSLNVMKKLHVDRPEGVEDPRESDLLHRVVMVFDAGEEQRLELMAEIDTWLANKQPDAAQPLRKAREAVDKYREFKEMGIEGKREVSLLKRDLREKERVMEAEKERTAAIEMNLIERSRELQSQVDAAQGEIEHLRAEVQRRTSLKNPLPPPPQPISLDRYAGFGPSQAGSSSQAGQWYNDHGRSMYLPSRGPIPANGTPYHRPRHLDDERENQGHESNGVRKDRKGKGRDPVDAANEVYRAAYGPPPLYQAPQSAPLIHEGPKPPKSGIIPGASPKSKFVPPDPDTELRERGFGHAYTVEAPEVPAELHNRAFDPARDAADPYSVLASAIPEYVNGFNQGYANGLEVVQRAIPSSSRTRESEAEGANSESDRERQERRAKRRREREEKKERHRQRELERERREHRARRDGEQAPNPHRNRPESGEYPSSSSRPHRASDDPQGGQSRAHRKREHQTEHSNPETTSHAPPLSTRRPSFSRPQTGPPPAPMPALLPTPAPSEIAQPTPRMAPRVVQETLDALDQSASEAVMLTPASRRSMETNGTVESWGTVSSRPRSPSSMISLNLANFDAPVIPLNAAAYESPVRHPTFPEMAQQGEEEEDEDDSTEVDTETEQLAPAPASNTRQRRHPDPPPLTHSHTQSPRSAQPRRRPQERSHTAAGYPTEQQWESQHPLSAPIQPPPGHGTRHTQALTIGEGPYHNPTLAYQPPPSAIRSASAAVPESGARQSSRNHRSRRDSQQHRSRHSGSQVPQQPSESTNHASNTRRRRVSFTAAPPANINASLSSLSLHAPQAGSSGGHPPGQARSDPSSMDSLNEAGYSTDVPYSGNALGLAISALDRDYAIAGGNRTGSRAGVVPLSQPRPVVPKTQFLRSFSHDTYGPPPGQ